MMNGLRFRPDTNIRDLSGKVMLRLRNSLDVAPDAQNWRALASILEPPFAFKSNEIEKMAMQIYSGGSPSGQLILELGSRGMAVCDLVPYLDQLRLEAVLTDFKNYEPIQITLAPDPYVKLFEGERLLLVVEATGFPYPRYQWFFESNEIHGAIENTLKIENVCVSQTGHYCCRLHNCADPNKTKFTQHSLVKVYPDLVKTSQPVLKKELSDERNDADYKGDFACNLPIIEEHPQDVFILKGRPFHVVCRAKSCFPLRYTWYHEGQYFMETEVSLLEVENALGSHNGRYQCIVRNDFGEARSHPFVVTVTDYDTPKMIKAPEIISHPKSCLVQLGGVALFVVEACGTQPITYQWIKDSTLIPGQNSSELRLSNIQSQEVQGVYQCLLKNEYGGKLTDGALLTISSELQAPQKYFAKDKFALLIGNYHYKAEKTLNAPKQDIKTLAVIFRSLQFKVVSLLNLTKIEMISAVEEFCQLLDDGVYCVFYFCGHGFEEARQCYLVPEDAPTGFTWEDCLCADQALDRMQSRNPAICCMILDICRRQNQVTSSSVPKIIEPRTTTAGNTIICFATSSGCAAFEYPQCGLLVYFLQRHLSKPIGIEAVFASVRSDMTQNDLCRDEDMRTTVRDPYRGKQMPEVRTNLTQPHRSLADKIEYHGGGTQAFLRRRVLWEAAHQRPPSCSIPVKPNELGIELDLDFQSEFSNVLHVFVTVKKKEKVSDCIAWVATIPNTLSFMDQPLNVTSSDCPFIKTKNIIQDLQKLKDRMEVTVAVQYTRQDSGDKKILNCEAVDLGFPLISQLNLWQPRTLSTPGHPVEQMEELTL